MLFSFSFVSNVRRALELGLGWVMACNWSIGSVGWAGF